MMALILVMLALILTGGAWGLLGWLGPLLKPAK
jgi:hypothetical protein